MARYEHDLSEGPQHQVEIGYRLAVGVYEIKHREFAQFVKDTGYDQGEDMRGIAGVCYTFEG